MAKCICASGITIDRVIGREILDSRGTPTVEVEVVLNDGSCGTAKVPSGASTGTFEAVELRDNDKKRYFGKGVETAVGNVNKAICELLKDKNPYVVQTDRCLLKLDKTSNKGELGANAILGTSMALNAAAAESLGIPLYRYLGGIQAVTMPLPMMNIINGGAHASNSLDVQEFMIVPTGAKSFKEGLRRCAEVYHTLKTIIKEKEMSTAVGDEGGFAPELKDEEEAIGLILEAVERAGYSNGKDFMISLDVAASEWKSASGKGSYLQPKQKNEYTTKQLIEKWCALCEKYPIFSIEDPLDEEDWDGWKELNGRIGGRVLLVGDDLFVTNSGRLRKGIENCAANAILIKLNQIGSVTETLETILLAKQNGMKTVISHRSGETEDTFIADLAVAVNAGYIKTGAPCRGERTAKYNRLLKIEEELSR